MLSIMSTIISSTNLSRETSTITFDTMEVTQSLRKQGSAISISISDEMGSTNYYNEDDAYIDTTYKGNNI